MANGQILGVVIYKTTWCPVCRHKDEFVNEALLEVCTDILVVPKILHSAMMITVVHNPAIAAGYLRFGSVTEVALDINMCSEVGYVFIFKFIVDGNVVKTY